MNDKFLDAMIKQSITMMTEACNGKELTKDEMMYDYACGSKKYGHDDLATFYITRAEQRLKMFDEDHAIILREIGKKKKKAFMPKKGNGIIFMITIWNRNVIQLIK